jgi:hypothetical protein
MTKNRCVFVLATPDYRPELCALTLPNLKRYADRLNADFIRIQERQFPNFPLTFERMQIYELGRGNEWNICIDADIIMSPHAGDFTTWIPTDTIANLGFYDLRNHFYVDEDPLFKEDSRFYGISDSFVGASKAAHELWRPLEGEMKQYIDLFKFKDDWAQRRISEFCISKNLALHHFKTAAPVKYVEDYIHLETTTGSIKDPEEYIYKKLKEWGEIP